MKTKKIRMPSLILMFAMILALVGCGSKVTAQGLIDDFYEEAGKHFLCANNKYGN